MFLKWAGVSPKKFVQFLSLSHTKTQLHKGGSVLDAAHAAGLSGGGRLHDLFFSIEAMTPGACKRGGAGLYQKFVAATLHHGSTAYQQQALMIFNRDWSCLRHIKLHLQASQFQIKTWEALLKIPMGAVASYGDVARHIGQPSAFRAVATAVASNPVAFLIPCHRVIRQNGVSGGYRWGSPRKQAMLGWEAAQTSNAA